MLGVSLAAQTAGIIDLTKVTYRDAMKSAYFQGTVLPVVENSTGNFAHYKFTPNARTVRMPVRFSCTLAVMRASAASLAPKCGPMRRKYTAV